MSLLNWKTTAMVKPADGQECVVFNPCDGFRIAEWDGKYQCFYQSAPFEPLSEHLAIFWLELTPYQQMLQFRADMAYNCI